MSESKRLDVAVFERELAQSRERAQMLIKAGQVFVNGLSVKKPSEKVSDNDKIEIVGDEIPFVSKGGLKLQKAIEVFKIDLTGYVCMDVGASTGGFTDCMLQNGAEKVYAVDVGSEQLAEKLRSDDRVINIEKTNFKDLTEKQVPQNIDFACADVSFISLRHIFPVMKSFLSENAMMVCLVKPQFEAGKEKIGKNGIVKDKKVHIQVINSVCKSAVEGGFSPVDVNFSPIKGQKGNIEYLLLLKRTENPEMKINKSIDDVINTSHMELNGGA